MSIRQGGAIRTVIQAASGSLSVVASSAIIYVILKSSKKLTTTLNRLLFGMSTCDIIFSTCFVLNTIPAPIGTPTLLNTSAYGNQITCNIQGFLSTQCSIMIPFYNCSLNVYYLCVVKYNISDYDIHRKVEPYLHILPILFSSLVSLVALVREYYNPNDSRCLLNTLPEFCAVDPDVECERGDQYIVLFISIAYIAPIFISFLIIIVSMTTIYSMVKKQEKIMTKKYWHSGVSAIRARTSSKQGLDRTSHHGGGRGRDERGSGQSRRNSGSISASLRKPVTNSRAIMHQAIAYIVAFLLSWICLLISFVAFAIIDSGPDPNFESDFLDVLDIMNKIFFPLQGLFNFVVFIFPKVTKQLRCNQEFTLWQGFIAAIQCKEVVSRRRRSSLDQVVAPHRTRNTTHDHNSNISSNRVLQPDPRRRSSDIFSQLRWLAEMEEGFLPDDDGDGDYLMNSDDILGECSDEEDSALSGPLARVVAPVPEGGQMTTALGVDFTEDLVLKSMDCSLRQTSNGESETYSQGKETDDVLYLEENDEYDQEQLDEQEEKMEVTNDIDLSQIQEEGCLSGDDIVCIVPNAVQNLEVISEKIET